VLSPFEVYDYSLTLDREVDDLFFIKSIVAYPPFFGQQIRLVWRSNWTIGKVLFLLTRYPTFVDVPLAAWGTSMRVSLDLKGIH
jgi:hypothetical protein